jgi:hypothetical protein
VYLDRYEVRRSGRMWVVFDRVTGKVHNTGARSMRAAKTWLQLHVFGDW